MAQAFADSSLISVRNLYKDFQSPEGGKFTVLENISLEIPDGQFVAILGLSGSGKSTLLRCMAGLMEPDRGIVHTRSLLPGYQRFSSFVFQSFALLPWLSVRENIEIVLRSLEPKERHEKAQGIISVAGLQGFEDAYPRQLSGGMRQRVGICRAIVADPMVLFMDEPFGALDPLTSQALRAELDRMWCSPERRTRSIVLVTHSLEEAVELADRIIVLSSRPGRVFQEIDIRLPRPRSVSSGEFKRIREEIERVFASLHLEKYEADLTEEAPALPAEGTKQRAPAPRRPRFPPVFDVTLSQIEGLLLELRNHGDGIYLYDLCDDMGQEANDVTPVVMSAELFGLVHTPGAHVTLTPRGQAYLQEKQPDLKRTALQQALLNHPLIQEVHSLVGRNPEGLEKESVLAHLALMLPFENPERQWRNMLSLCMSAGLLAFDSDRELLFQEL